MGKSKSQVTGYKYLMTLHMGLCKGPINVLKEIQVGGLTAWPKAQEAAGGSGYTTYASYVAMIAAGIFAATGVLAQVTGDVDPSKDGVYQKQHDGWLKLSGAGVDPTGTVTDSSVTSINAPLLFGGDKKEGGIQGVLHILMGEADQVAPAILTSVFGALPGFRRCVTLAYDGLIASNNPYPKPWRFRVARWDKGWKDDEPWYQDKARILLAGGLIEAMNPAHMIYQVLTDREFGRNLPAAALDENSFVAAANTFCAENFGLCLFWSRQDDIDAFIQTVCDHVGAVVYTDRGTGLITLRPIRDDYVVGELPLFDETSGLIDIEDDEDGAVDIVTNEVVVDYKDPITGKPGQVRVPNLAAFHASGATASKNVKYPGLPVAELALRVGQRDMRLDGAGIKRKTVKLDRRGWRIAPGMPFAISAPSRGIAFMILRAGPVDDGTHTDGVITVKAASDIFGLPQTSYISPPDPEGGWTPPDTSLAVITRRVAFEASYRDRVLTASTATDEEALVAALAAQPSASMIHYDMWTQPAGGERLHADDGDWAPNALLDAVIEPYATEIALTSVAGFDGGLSHGLLIAGAGGFEICNLTAYDTETGLATIERGCADTVPRRHLAATKVFVLDGFAAADSRTFEDGEDVAVRLLSVSGSDATVWETSPEDSVTIVSRAARPYPPGDVQVNAWPALGNDSWVDGGDDIDLTWVHRDRLTQQDDLVPHDAAGIGPEAGTTYTVRVYDASDDTLLDTIAAISGTSHTYSVADWTGDGSALTLRFELEAVRDALTSWQMYDITVYRDPAILLGEDGQVLFDEENQPLMDETA